MNNGQTPAAPIFNERGGVLDLTNGHQDDSYLMQTGRRFSTGLTKREELAKAAMMGLLPMAHNGTEDRSREIAKMAVMQADALLEQLEQEKD